MANKKAHSTIWESNQQHLRTALRDGAISIRLNDHIFVTTLEDIDRVFAPGDKITAANWVWKHLYYHCNKNTISIIIATKLAVLLKQSAS